MPGAALTVHSSTRDGSCLLTLAGDLDEETAVILHEHLWRCGVGEEGVRLVMDLSGVRLLDSAGLSALIAAHKRLQWHGEALTLANCPPLVIALLELTGLSDVFTLVSSGDEALQRDSEGV